ncbi:MAG: xanthine dehydrogenase family protein subunit M [Rhodospirillaceae bacterium]|jgi:carbon-monoxide dehydrogenase medium subunit|nr:xanthine dehydrogenase family protein subunit M [Rhodospirillaceae bacterium]MBT4045952.1 xanthine dehydrogenase family protein subunit M [Rhodospirillaceae bacterium]MBT4690218.1 xanthine dehydrogenase family protein subunit M [Rhodospirillaceae bacterium]MBT5080783.1 xanthine dehydrogenase family protein subunit M [Rhodospirillaceae bacterium]MBT5525205.1 xanthine dehydrogenase family protein subunit M [Rhodospirillaceae bacterium]
MRYEAPGSVDEAVKLLADANGAARILAGGTDLLVQLRAGMISPEVVVDIKNIAETEGITADGGGFCIGSTVSGAAMGEHADLCAAWPGVVEGVELIGSTQVQGRATMVGNLCNASPAADGVPALIAAGATCTIVGPKGQREVPVADIPTGPGKNSLANGEFVINVKLPARPANASDAYLRMIPRTEMDIAIVGAGVNLVLDGSGTCTEACVVLGAVGPKTITVADAAAALVGSKVDDAALAAVAAAASAAATPIDDKRGTVAYRTKVAGVLASRAATIAAERARS